MKTKTFDAGVYDLACRFLADHPKLDTAAARITLAQAIQQAVENEIDFIRNHMEEL